MWGAASFPFRCARCSCTPVWVRGSRSSRRCPYRVAVPPEGGGASPALGGRRAAPVAPQLRWVRGGGGGAPPRPLSGLSGRGGGFGMTPWCVDLVCSWRRLLADRHSLPFPWTLSLHRRWCPSASHHPLTFLFLLALTFPLPSPFPSLGLSLCRPPCPSASPHSFPSLSLGRLCQRTKGGGGSVGGPLVPWRCLLSAWGGGRHGSPVPGGPAIGRGVAPFPAPLY